MRDAGPAKRAKSDQPVGITFDMDTEEAALTAAALVRPLPSSWQSR